MHAFHSTATAENAYGLLFIDNYKRIPGFKSVAWFLFVITITILPLSSGAQTLFSNIGYKGIDVSFGTRAFRLRSNLPELDRLPVLEEGGQLGIIVGNNLLRTKIGVAGFFYAANTVARTVDLFESDVSINFYPLELINPNAIVRPYLTGGLVYDKTKFYGHYLDRDKGAVNYSSKEPFLGQVHHMGILAGAGVEVSVLNNDFDFVHIFSEAKYGRTLAQKASKEIFKNTTFLDQWIINIGVRFGIRNGVLYN